MYGYTTRYTQKHTGANVRRRGVRGQNKSTLAQRIENIVLQSHIVDNNNNNNIYKRRQLKNVIFINVSAYVTAAAAAAVCRAGAAAVGIWILCVQTRLQQGHVARVCTDGRAYYVAGGNLGGKCIQRESREKDIAEGRRRGGGAAAATDDRSGGAGYTGSCGGGRMCPVFTWTLLKHTHAHTYIIIIIYTVDNSVRYT